jgi:signal transduction histidine kinase
VEGTNAARAAGRAARVRAGFRRPLVADVLAAGIATAVAIAHLVTASEVGARPPDAVGLLLLSVAGGILIVRRRWPVAVLIAVVGVTYIYLVQGYPGGAELPLLMVGFFTALAEGRRIAGSLLLAGVTVTGVSYRLGVDGDDPALVIATVSLLAMAAMLGEAARVRRDLRAEVRERLRALAVEKELEARAELVEERLAIARELHDVLAHTITALSVQASAAADGMDEGSEQHATLRGMRATAQEAMAQLGATIELLRADPRGGSKLSAPDLRGLEALADTVRATGIEVEVVHDGGAQALPAEVELTAYRIVQEALTNVIRHAEAAAVQVRIAARGPALTITVADDGRGAEGGSMVEGHGILGMRERVEALGGRLRVATSAGGGFEVEATLPEEAVTW